LVLVALYTGYRVVVRPFFFIDFDPMRFESAKWKASEADFEWDSLRLRMADSLLKTHPLVGLSKVEVIELLGEPDDTEHFRDYEMVYFLGLERNTMAIDGEWLAIDLDESDIVTGARLVVD
jgi:hypothetical protein